MVHYHSLAKGLGFRVKGFGITLTCIHGALPLTFLGTKQTKQTNS
jgi:hypothetical protein